jgi:type IV secretory pathway TraG/TraD family ATPase VirD4
MLYFIIGVIVWLLFGIIHWIRWNRFLKKYYGHITYLNNVENFISIFAGLVVFLWGLYEISELEKEHKKLEKKAKDSNWEELEKEYDKFFSENK